MSVAELDEPDVSPSTASGGEEPGMSAWTMRTCKSPRAGFVLSTVPQPSKLPSEGGRAGTTELRPYSEHGPRMLG